MKGQVLAIGIALASSIAMSTSAFGLPTPNQQGDYPIPPPRNRGDRQVNWQVVDADPKGLNCRMAKQFQGVRMDSLDTPDELYQRNRYDVSQWPVVTRFRRGQRIQAVTGNLANQIVVVDRRGKMWLPIHTGKGDCLVRANSRFIRPLREDPTTLKPLE